MEADLHNKNLMDLVAQKDDTAEQHQVLYTLPRPLTPLFSCRAVPAPYSRKSENEGRAVPDSSSLSLAECLGFLSLFST